MRWRRSSIGEQGLPLGATYAESTEETFDACAETMLDAITNRYPDEPVMRCYGTAMPAFYSLTTHLCYLVAAGPRLGELRQHPRWLRLVGGNYDAMSIELAPLSSAAEPAPATQLQEAAGAVAAVLYDWLTLVGFEVRDLEDGGIYFDVLRSWRATNTGLIAGTESSTLAPTPEGLSCGRC